MLLPPYIYVSIDSGMRCTAFKESLVIASSLRIIHCNYKILKQNEIQNTSP
jgi:hypothetical protein